MPLKLTRYGWIRDLPDQRDHLYAAPRDLLLNLPASADLRKQCPPVYDQGAINSCTANAIAAALEFDQMRQKLSPIFVPSRLFIYYNERAIEGTVNQDSGAQIRDGIKSVAQQGDCPETLWPYVDKDVTIKPPVQCYQQALKFKVVQYQRLAQTLNQYKGCLASGSPFIFGFTVYASFESKEVAQTGHVSMPTTTEAVIGGHAVMAVGYDDSESWFIVRNSWGTSWGMQGYFTMPYAYLLEPHLSSDFWTIRVVS